MPATRSPAARRAQPAGRAHSHAGSPLPSTAPRVTSPRCRRARGRTSAPPAGTRPRAALASCGGYPAGSASRCSRGAGTRARDQRRMGERAWVDPVAGGASRGATGGARRLARNLSWVDPDAGLPPHAIPRRSQARASQVGGCAETNRLVPGHIRSAARSSTAWSSASARSRGSSSHSRCTFAPAAASVRRMAAYAMPSCRSSRSQACSAHTMGGVR